MQHYQECIALGSKTGISLVSKANPVKINGLYRDIWKAIFLFERRFSRFLPDSELSLFNRNAGIKQIISPEFHGILTAACAIAKETNGLYNPFILPALQSAGYSHSRVLGHEKDAVDDYSNKSVGNIDQLEIGDDWARIPYGTAIDIGGCGKGYLADQLRSQLADAVEGYWLSFGGDIAIGGRAESGQPWVVAIQSAGNEAEDIGEFSITTTCGIATSGTTVHKGKKAGKTWHHIIDPRTRQPAETDVLLATVQAGSSMRADVLASCAVILGSVQGLKFLKNNGVKSAVLQCKTATSNTSILHFGKNIKFGGVYA